MDLLLSDGVSKQLDNYLESPVHGLLLVAAKGSGKKSLAKLIAAKVLETTEKKLDNYPYLTILGLNDAASISIEEIRAMIGFMRLKVPGDKNIRRVAMVFDAERMTREAQNSILKILEEPPADTVIILTATDTSGLLQTVLSRVSILAVDTPGHKQSLEYFVSKGYSEQEINKAYLVSGARVGLMSSILSEEGNTSLMDAINSAKQLLTANKFDRLKEVDKMSRTQKELPDVLFAMERILQAALDNATKANNLERINKTISSIKAVEQAKKAMVAKANTKLMLTNLMLSI